MKFQEKLDKVIRKNSSLLCVGLDHHLFSFNKKIIDQTYDLVCAYKPNSAFYEAFGAKGLKELKLTCKYIQEIYSEIPIILDAKRGDIGSTNEGYVKYAFDWLGVDAITLHPYLGFETLSPFLNHIDKGCFILCRTSNSGSGEFQNLKIDSKPLYKIVAEKVIREWNKNKNCFIVVAATYPKELKKIRKIAGDMTFLVPGVGTQGGGVKTTIQAGINSNKEGLIISSSSAIIFSKYPREEAKKLRDEIERYRK